MPKLTIRGRLEALPENTTLAKALPPGMVIPKYSAQLQLARGVAQMHTLDIAPDDVVELELEGGIRLWVRADDLQKDYGAWTRSSTLADRVDLPAVLPIGSPSRGQGEWLIKGLKVLGVDLAGSITDFVAEMVEGILKPEPGLYQCSSGDADDLNPIGKLRADVPILLFIHGTASTTSGSFGGLWEGAPNALIASLLQAYGDGQVLAFQHRTFTQSPVENALEAAQKLPKGARLHLVSHSRGGLVGELLCRAMLVGRIPFDDSELALFDSSERKRDSEALRALRDELMAKEFRIERFVRVACPARGTTLADRRLDRYLSIIVNILEQIPGLKSNPAYDAFSALLLAVVKKRTDPSELPGLEAMMPEAPLIRILNRPGLLSKADLHVLGGDIAGLGLWSRLKVFVTDLFYREDHDLVVNTPSMFGGAARAAGIVYWIDTGSNVNHFSYFRNGDTASRLLSALTKSDAGSYHSLQQAPYEVTEDDYRKRAVGPQPVVFLLPGIMGSHLKAGNNRIWMDVCSIATGALDQLQIGAENILADGLVAASYRELVRYLAQTHEVVPFAYDWRRSIADAADKLCAQIEKMLPSTEATGQPIRILAHSMGGLVVRAMIATVKGQEVWERMCRHSGARIIMLGTPNGGSHAIAGVLMGRDPLVRKLALLDFKHTYGQLLNYFSSFEGILQLLPHNGSLDVYDSAAWARLQANDLAGQRGIFSSDVAGAKSAGFAWPVPDDKRLTDARKIRDLLRDSPIDPERMIYVAGCADATACDIVVDPAAPEGRRVAIYATAYGDGRVPWATGIPAELKDKTYYMPVEHGDLANCPEAFPALLELMNVGATSKLPLSPPARRGAASETFVLPIESVAYYPDEEDLIASALGSKRRRTKAEPARKARVRVVHGNLARAVSPVFVGHYRGDTIVSAESYLDRQLEGRLRRTHRVDLYPGELGTNAIFLNPEEGKAPGGHPGAVVAGLGTVGDLSPGALAGTLSRAATAYGLELIDRELARRRHAQPGPGQESCISAPISTLLIGTGAAGLTVADSLQAILRAVHQANLRLQPPRPTPSPKGDKQVLIDAAEEITAFIDTIDVIELWEDRAIQAAKSLLDLGRSAEFREKFEIQDHLIEQDDGRKRAYFNEEPEWWQRMRVTTQRNGSLKFEAFTERARAESFLQLTQRKLVESFLDRAVASTASDPDLGCTLFELLVPNPLKEHAPDRRNMALVLDEASASYPWELMQDRFSAGLRPLSVEAGLVRQLATPRFRERVLHATDSAALVIGDPTAHDVSGTFPALPGAAAEARGVARQLRDHGFDKVIELVAEDATPQAALAALYARPYRILHVAAHGVLDYSPEDDVSRAPAGSAADNRAKRKTVTGVVLGDGMFLTPAEIEQMRFVPELVFVNCCYLGQTRTEGRQHSIQYHRLAANIATQLIRMGVRAVVAAGWAVDDEAAGAFARKFYDELFRGRTFGDAVRLAREEIYLRYGATNTWGAYQCYGDPDFSLRKDVSRVAPRETRIVSQAELRVELENVARSAKTAASHEEESWRTRLDYLAKSAVHDWLESAATCAAFGQAYAELGMFEQAVHYYELARCCQPADARVDSMEQLANLKVRWAAQLLDDMGLGVPGAVENESTKKAAALLDDAAKLLDGLDLIQGTQERHALRGSLSKRQAFLKDPAERRKWLEAMADSYAAAYRVGVQVRSPNLYYPLGNQLAADIILGWTEAADAADNAHERRLERIKTRLDELGRLAENATEKKSDFWTLCIKPDFELLRCLSQQQLTPDRCDDIARGYLLARRRGGSAREIRSVCENIVFFAKMAATEADESRRDELVRALQKLRTTLLEHG